MDNGTYTRRSSFSCVYNVLRKQEALKGSSEYAAKWAFSAKGKPRTGVSKLYGTTDHAKDKYPDSDLSRGQLRDAEAKDDLVRPGP